MAKDQKFRATLSIDTEADFSSLIKAMDKVQTEMHSKGIYKASDLSNMDKTLDKIKQIQERLKILKERGFTSPKEVSDYNHLMDQLLSSASDLQATFQQVHLGGLDKEIEDAKKAFKDAEKSMGQIETKIESIAKKQLSAVSGADNYASRIKTAIKNGEDLVKVQKDLNDAIDDEIKKKQDAINKSQQALNAAAYAQQAALPAATKVGAAAAKRNFIPIDDAEMHPTTGTDIQAAVQQAYTTAINSKSNSGKGMFKVFKDELADMNLQFVTGSKYINAFKASFNSMFDSSGANKIAQNKNQIKKLTEELDKLKIAQTNVQDLLNPKNALQEQAAAYQNAAQRKRNAEAKVNAAQNAKINNSFSASIENSGRALAQANGEAQRFQSTLNNMSNAQVQFDSLSYSVSNFARRILSLTTAYHTLRRVIRATFTDIKNLDKAFGSIAMVTNYKVSDMWQQYSTYAQMANKLGQTTLSVIEASGLYYQQGLKTSEVLKLTEETMKLATLAGLDFKDATSQMTGALRAFHMEMSEGAHVTDVYASLAANAAADVSGISSAMSATAAIAHSAGMSFNNTAAMLTTMIEATQEAPKNLGTAMKAVIARFTELKKGVAGTSESEFADLDFNKVDTALKSVGISIKDAAGQFRNLDEIFLELAEKWNTLDRNTQRYVATIAAGSRQQSRFIALMENYDRTMELIEIADNSASKADKQFNKYSDTIEFKLNRLKNAWEQAKTSVFTGDFFSGLITGANYLVEKLEGLNWQKLLVIVPVALAAGRMMGKAWIQGFGEGANNVRGFVNRAGSKINPLGKNPTELRKDYKAAKASFGDGFTYKEYKKAPQQALNQSETFRNLVAEQRQKSKEYDAARKEVGVIRASYNQQQAMGAVSPVTADQLDKAKEKARQAKSELENAQNSVQSFRNATRQSFEEIKQQRNNLYKVQAWSALGQTAGMAVGTALTMGIMGTFKASEIGKTIGIQMATTSASMFASGNWIGGLVSAAATGLGFLFSYISNKVEEDAEKQKRLNDEVYDLSKQIEAAEEKQKELNDAFDKANTKFEKQKEQYDTFTSAKNTYEELSQKVILTTEEQEKLNQATEDLVNLHPELVNSYDSQGKAILSIGKAWDDAAKSEKEYYINLRKDKIEAEAQQLQGEYKLATLYQNQDEALIKQKRQIYSGNTGIKVKKGYLTKEDYEDTYKSIQEILDIETWDWLGDFGNYFFPDIEDIDAETYVRELLFGEQRNSAFEEAFIKAVNDTFDTSFKNAEQAFDKLFKGEEDENWAKVAQKIREEIANWENLDLTQVDKTKVRQVATNIGIVLSDEIDLLLDEFEGTEEAKKQLIADLRKSDATTEQIQDLMYQLDKDGKVISPENIAKEILEKEENKELAEAYEKTSIYQMNLISEYYEGLYTRTKEENEKYRKKLEKLGIASPILGRIDFSTEQVNQDSEILLNQLKALYNAPPATNTAQEYQQRNGIFDLKDFQLLDKVSKMGYESQKAFMNSFSNFSPEVQEVLVNSLNTLLKGSIVSVSKNKESISLLGIETEMLQRLVSVSWKDLTVIDLKDEEEKFLNFAKEQGKDLELAKDYWNSYKTFMSNLGILDLAKQNLSTDALLKDLEENLDEKLKSAKLSSAVESSLRNGFITFQESNDFRTACEKMGLDAADFIAEGINGMEKIDVDAFEKAIKEQQVTEEQVVETLKQEYEEKINTLEQQKSLIEGTAKLTSKEEQAAYVAKKLANQYERAAYYAWAAANDLNPEKVYTKKGEESFAFEFDENEAQAVIESIDAQIGGLRSKINNDLKVGSEFMTSYMARLKSYYYQIYSDIAKGKKSATEAYSDLKQAELDMAAADKALTRAKEDLTEKEYQQEKAQRALNRAINGDPYRTGKLDGLYNYSTALENISRKASKAKEKLDDLSKGDNVDQLLATYTTEIHNQVVIRGAEDSAIKTAMANTEKQLAQYSEYWDKIGDTYVININKLNAASMSDLLKDEIENQVDQLNKWQKILYDNQDAIDKLRKQFEDDQKKALQSYVDMEKEVVNTLKEQYEKQIKDLKDKNEAMKDADDDYLDALEKAIDKERKLRDRQNQWDDLAKKEKKLSLISRDTSGAQQIEAQKLQEEVEKDRTQLLDDTIDDVVDSLKELYELQQESREAEIEYMEAMLDNANLIKEANEVIQSWGSNEDAVNWFLTNKDLTKMSAAEIELEKKNWNDLYEAKILYEKQSKIDFDKYLEATQEEINEKIGTFQTSITDQSAKAFAQVKENIDDAIHSAQQAYDNAKRSYDDQAEAMGKLQMTADAAKDFYLTLKALVQEKYSNPGDILDLGKGPLTSMPEERTGTGKFGLGPHEVKLPQPVVTDTTKSYPGKQTADQAPADKGDYNSYVSKRLEWSERNRSTISWYGSSPLIWSLDDEGWKDSNINDLSKIGEVLAERGYHGYINNNKLYLYDKGISVPYPTVNSAEDAKKLKGYSKFAKGGLVDYTGPAWVDGSPSSPEAFLSVDDTRLIGNLVNLLTNIPSLNSNTNPTQFSTSNIGDTTVNLTVNFDSVSEDYDADRVIDLMKEKIVEAANYTGANVILNKR